MTQPFRRPCLAGCLAGVLAGLSLALAGCGADEGQVALCERVLRHLTTGRTVDIIDRVPLGGAQTGVRLTYRDGPDEKIFREIRCLFASGGLQEGRLRLMGVIRDDGKPLHRLSFIRLRRQLNLD